MDHPGMEATLHEKQTPNRPSYYTVILRHYTNICLAGQTERAEILHAKGSTSLRIRSRIAKHYAVTFGEMDLLMPFVYN